VLAYLQAGGDPERIAQLAAEWGAVEQVPTYLSAISSDLNNDGMDELALAGTIEPLNSATIWIYQCGFADYFLAATFPIAGGPLMWIGFLRTEERTPTDFPFLILGYAAWGQSNVFAVVGWDSRAWRLFIQQVTTRGNIAVYGDGKHGRAYVDFLEATTASMAGGPPRGLLTSYVWDRDTYVPLPTFYAPSSQRIHLLEDAQRALDEGLLGQAVAIYDVAATDDMYFSAPSQYEVDAGLEEQAEAYQTAFALFRYAAIWAALGDESYAGTIATNMARSYPARAPGSEFGDGLRLFLDRLHEGESNSAACRAVDSSLGSTYPHLSGDDGHVGYWGMSNVSYDFSELCPF
jgi:hypothetical protein